MKVAILTRNFPPDSLWGGDAVYYANLARGLATSGHEVHVICQAVARRGTYVEDYGNGRVVVHRVGTDPRRWSVRARVDYSLHAWHKVRELTSENAVQIVEAADWAAEGFLYVLVGKRTPLVISALGSTDTLSESSIGFMRGLTAGRWLLNAAAGFTCARSDAVVAVSLESHRAVIRRYGLKPGEVRLIYPGIDTQKFRPTVSDIRRRLGITQVGPVVGFVGRLEPRNGVHVLWQAIPKVAEEVPNVTFVIVGRDTPTAPGGGPWKHYLETRFAAQTSRRILHVDFLPDDDLIRLYSACDVIVYPALTSTFGFPALEAMACGRPVVATRVGIIPEIETEGLRGVAVVSPGSPRELAGAIIQSVRWVDVGRTVCFDDSRRFVERKFSTRAWVGEVTSVYQELLARWRS